MNKLAFSVILAIVIISLHTIYPTTIRADREEISLIKDEVESNFPNGIKFYIEASSTSVIDDIRMIQEKCEGNLDEGERQTLEKYLSDLQLQYLAAEKGDVNQGQAPNEENVSSEETDPGT